MRALALLSMWKTRNALRTLFTDPRKLVPALFIFFVILLSLLFGTLGLRQAPGQSGLGESKVDPQVFDAAVFAAMILIAVGSIDTGLGDGLLAFGMSDVDYVFPSPISRRVVLAYRLPSLTFAALFSSAFLIYMYHVVIRVINIDMPNPGHLDPPGWYGSVGVALCVGLYFNLAMFLAVRVENRRLLHRLLIAAFITSTVLLALIGYMKGVTGFVSVMRSPILEWAFYPGRLAATGLVNEVRHASDPRGLAMLFWGYVLSAVPMFLTNSNYYEQSIASSERVAAWRRAAKAGLAAQQASRAANVKYKGTREYTVKPFGRGPLALAWAHLCAAGKRPYVNFLSPLIGGIGCGVLGGIGNAGLDGVGEVVVVLFTVYASMGFMAAAKTASESAVRRRELIAPLPIKGWESVAANLAVPWLSMFEFCAFAGLAYAVTGSRHWPEVLFGLAVFFPMRLAARMVLQYILVLSYPDFSDKVQQFLAMGVYYLCAVPFFVVELVLAIPAILLHSIWIGLITLTVLQIGFLALLLLGAGLANDRSVASGEPVRLFRLVSKRS